MEGPVVCFTFIVKYNREHEKLIVEHVTSFGAK